MIADLQRRLASLIRGEVVEGDAYIDEVARSTGLEVTRWVIASWRDLLLRQGCPLTVALLKQRGRYTVGTGDAPAYLEELIAGFLEPFITDADPLLAAVARTERAIAMDESAEIAWPCDPEAVIGRLRRGEPVHNLPPGDYYVMIGEPPRKF